MTCEEIQDQIKPFFDDLLTEDDYQAICDHLDECGHCRHFAASTSSMSYMLRELGDLEVPKDLTASIRFYFEKMTGDAAVDSSHHDKKLPSSSRAVKIMGITAAVVLVAGFIMFGKGKDLLDVPKTGTQEMNSKGETVVVEVGKEPRQEPVSKEKAEYLYKKLQTMADSLEQVARDNNKEEKAGQAKPEGKKDTAPDSSSGSAATTVQESVPESISLHWHIPYSMDAERDQLVSTVKILGINPDYEDQDFLIFKATGRQLKLLIDGIQFSNRTELGVPGLILAEGFANKKMQVGIHFIKHFPFQAETHDVPILKKGGTFVSVEQPAPSDENVLDWHILLISTQRDLLLDIILRGGGKIVYASGDVAIFSILSARIGTLKDEIRGTGGVFADFGRPGIGGDALIRGAAKVLIYFKKQ